MVLEMAGILITTVIMVIFWLVLWHSIRGWLKGGEYDA